MRSSTLLGAFFPACFFTLYESFAWETFKLLGFFTWPVYVRNVSCNFESKQAISKTLFGQRPNNYMRFIKEKGKKWLREDHFF